MQRSVRHLAGALVAVAVVLGGCTPETTEPEPAPTDVDAVVRGTNSFQFEPDEFTVPANGASVALQCEQSLPHDLVVELPDGDRTIAECQGGSTTEGTLDLPAGTYTFFCSIPGHRAAGMEGTVTVG